MNNNEKRGEVKPVKAWALMSKGSKHIFPAGVYVHQPVPEADEEIIEVLITPISSEPVIEEKSEGDEVERLLEENRLLRDRFEDRRKGQFNDMCYISDLQSQLESLREKLGVAKEVLKLAIDGDMFSEEYLSKFHDALCKINSINGGGK